MNQNASNQFNAERIYLNKSIWKKQSYVIRPRSNVVDIVRINAIELLIKFLYIFGIYNVQYNDAIHESFARNSVLFSENTDYNKEGQKSERFNFEPEI